MNWTLTISAIAIFVFAMWPEMVGDGFSKWFVVVAAVIVVIVAWTGVTCKPCAMRKGAKGVKRK